MQIGHSKMYAELQAKNRSRRLVVRIGVWIVHLFVIAFFLIILGAALLAVTGIPDSWQKALEANVTSTIHY